MCAEYNAVCSFGGVYFGLGNAPAYEVPATLKTNIGKAYSEKEIPIRNDKNTVIRVEGVITGLSRTSAQTLSQAIEIDRAALIALDDGYKHAWDDGKHSGDFVIVTGSLRWAGEANRSPGQPYKFTMEVKEW